MFSDRLPLGDQQHIVCEPEVQKGILRLINHYAIVLSSPAFVQILPFLLKRPEAHLHDCYEEQAANGITLLDST